jgi:1-acyl-sn-glycerol-3-phosphate acyltransferase
MQSEKRFLKNLGSGLRLALGGVVAALVAVILAPPMLLATLFTSSGRPGQIAGYVWSLIVARVLGVSASLEGADKVEPGQSYVVTPNHQGNVDVLAIEMVLPVPVYWVIKKELTRIPFFGWALARSGAVTLDRSNREAALEKLIAGADRMANGWSLLVYPEGTRSPDGNLQPFKTGAFRLALQAGIPVLPVTINGAFRIWPKKTLCFRPGHMVVSLGDPIPTQGLTEDDIPALMERTRNAMEKDLDVDYDPFLQSSTISLPDTD